MTMSLFEVVKRNLDNNDWKYDVAREGSLIKAGAKGENGSFAVVFDVKEDRNILVLYVISNVHFPVKNRDKLAVYLTYCNYGMTLGNFEMDMSDGEVRFKNSVNTTGTQLSEEMVDELLKISLVVMDRFFAGMIKVSYTDLDPKEAYDQISSDSVSSVLQEALAAALEESVVSAKEEEDEKEKEGDDKDEQQQPMEEEKAIAKG
uniref:YbjN domain-containing protein n=1 Tax=Cyclophora tenuis TaxID=216820 RepID=A0A7S1GPJ9_CYCTE|mmetsp:Transcript_465/g.807  ORF Transcript_465/g.807 Transcript_465/m.807 type:complete len:204 (+) Transcript_465:94-705(+)